MSVRSQFKRYLILIVVVFHIGTKSQEQRKLTRLQIGKVINKALGMYPHLKALIVTQIKGSVTVDGTCVTRLKPCHLHRHRLLVELRYLRLSRVGYTAHTRRQHIIHRLASCILLDVYDRQVKLALDRSVTSRIEIEVIGPPLPAHKLKSRKTQMRNLLEPGEENAGKPYSREVGYGAYNAFIVAQRNLELIPLHLLILTVTCTHKRHLLVGDVVLSHYKIFGTNRHLVLEVTLILVKRVVLIYILDIGTCASRLVQRIGSILGRKRVAFNSVVTLVTLQNRQSLDIVVVTSVKVVVVAGRVIECRKAIALHAFYRGRRELALQPLKIVTVSAESKLLIILQSVKTHILHKSRPSVVVKGIGQ